MYGIMGDMVDEKFKKYAKEIDELTSMILSHAEKFDMDYIAEKFMGKWVVADEHAEDFMDDLMLYEDYAMWDNLARNLARRDLARIYSLEQLEEMDQMKYLELESTIEEKYNKEFEAHGLGRIEIKK